MPIYLVRWPDLTASLVRAVDEDELVDILDQEANPEGCEWSVYDGPLFINITLPAEWSIKDDLPGEPIAPEQVVVGDVTGMADSHILDSVELSFVGDDGFDAGMEILRKAFPRVYEAHEKLLVSKDGLTSEGAIPEAQLRKALHGELARLLGWSWREAQLSRKTDLISALARELDMPVEQVRKRAQQAFEQTLDEENDPDPSGDK